MTINPLAYKLFFLLSTLEGIIVLLYLLLAPSETSYAVFLQYTTRRLILSAVTALTTLFFCGLFIRSLARKKWLVRLDSGLQLILLAKNRLGRWFVALLLAALIILTLILLFNPSLSPTINDMPYTLPRYSVAEDIQQNVLIPFATRLAGYWNLASFLLSEARVFLLWLILLCVQSAALLFFGYHKDLLWRWKTGDRSRFYNLILLVLVFGATFYHWLTLIFRLKTFLLIRGWKWYFWQKEAAINPWIFLIILAITVSVTLLVLTWRRRRWLCLGLIILLGYGLQIGFASLTGNGFEYLKDEYANSVFNYYAIEAASETSLMETLKDYEALYGPHGYLGTKPPGVHIFYVATQKLADLLHPEVTPEGRFERATTLMATLYPLLAMLTLVPMELLGRRLIPEKENTLPATLLYIVCPNVILITLFLDQALYPLLFMSGLLLAHNTMRNNSLTTNLVLGLYLYTVTYFGYSLLALIPMVFLWIVIDHLMQRRSRSVLDTIILLIGIIIGMLIAYLLLSWLLHYDFITRYQRSFEYHREIKEFEPGLAMIAHTALLNNAEFFSWTGFSIILLFLSNLMRGIGAFFRRQAKALDGLLLSFSAAYAGTVVFGQTFGEVQRLYIFMAPLFALFAAEEIQKRFKKKDALLISIIVLQLITALLLFIFQDYYA